MHDVNFSHIGRVFGGNLSRSTCLRSNYALERSVRRCGWRAAGARKIFAPAARRFCLARPAQRER